MELELNPQRLQAFDRSFHLSVPKEESLDLIVPDSYPDVLRVLDISAVLLAGEREVLEGSVRLSGAVRASILYVPEGEGPVCALDATLPFSCTGEGTGITPTGTKLVTNLKLRSLEAKPQNPRKLQLRAGILAEFTGFSIDQICQGCDPDSFGVDGVELQTETKTAFLVKQLAEKEFTFAEEMNLSGNKPEIGRLLSSRLTLAAEKGKVLGEKVAFQGKALLSLLYSDPEGSLCSGEFELPFSQLMSLDGLSSAADCDIDLLLLEFRLEPGSESAPEDRRCLTIQLELLAQLTVCETEELSLITDLYSTCCKLIPQREELRLISPPQSRVRHQSGRELLETSGPVRSVTAVSLELGPVQQRRKEEGLEVFSEARLCALYLDEENCLRSAGRPLRLSCMMEEAAADEICLCSLVTSGEVFGLPAAEGIEVRFALDARAECFTPMDCVPICGARVDPEGACADRDRPSLTLRRARAGERLWDIAKCYGTTVGELCAANGLEEEQLSADRLLLIPQKRGC